MARPGELGEPITSSDQVISASLSRIYIQIADVRSAIELIPRNMRAAVDEWPMSLRDYRLFNDRPFAFPLARDRSSREYGRMQQQQPRVSSEEFSERRL